MDTSKRVIDLVTDAVPSAEADVRRTVERFADNLATYGELIAGPNHKPVGFMTRGEDADFTRHVSAQMEAWELAEMGRSVFAGWANLFEHRRMFAKFEWDGDDRLAAFYFRRRPTLDEIIEHLGALDVASECLSRAATVGRLLAKNTVHFVAGATRSGHDELHFKLYFSQWVTEERAPGVTERVRRVLDFMDVSNEARRRFDATHHTLAPPHFDPSIFISLNFTRSSVKPWVKIDYPEVPPNIAAGVLEPDQQQAAVAEMKALTERAGAPRVSYLGVRFPQDGLPTLKYYADFPKD